MRERKKKNIRERTQQAYALVSAFSAFLAPRGLRTVFGRWRRTSSTCDGFVMYGVMRPCARYFRRRSLGARCAQRWSM